jgi:uncharacterized membrane protein YccC
MEAANLAIAVCVALGSLIGGVVTIVWAVAQIRGTTLNLGTEIRHLADEIRSIRDGHKDHEDRIRKIEQRHRS